ncbi:MAG: hypothetical protein G4V63_24125, partial [Candidatus Afipia apatlaquensis]|nr:hypothetical protein [Candidatus Afipia apatlaquensis]
MAVAYRRRISSLLLGRAARNVLARASGKSVALSRFWPGRTDRSARSRAFCRRSTPISSIPM